MSNSQSKILGYLNESLAELSVRIVPTKQISIVEFCHEYTMLQGIDLVNFCEGIIDEIPYVIITEDVAAQIGSNLKDAAKWATSGRSLGSDTKPTASGIKGLSQKLGNFVGTHGSAVRNSAIIKQVDKNRNTKYLLFPDIDTNRPGHERVLQALVKAEQDAGNDATIVNSGDAQRQAIQNSPTEVRLPEKIKNFSVDKSSIIKALNDLSNYANQQKLNFTRYNFIAPEEISQISAQVSKSLGAISNAAKDEQAALSSPALAQTMTNIIQTETSPNDVNGVAAGQAFAKTMYAGTNTTPAVQPEITTGTIPVQKDSSIASPAEEADNNPEPLDTDTTGNTNNTVEPKTDVAPTITKPVPAAQQVMASLPTKKPIQQKTMNPKAFVRQKKNRGGNKQLPAPAKQSTKGSITQH